MRLVKGSLNSWGPNLSCIEMRSNAKQNASEWLSHRVRKVCVESKHAMTKWSGKYASNDTHTPRTPPKQKEKRAK